MSSPEITREELSRQVQELRSELGEAQETLRAIREGEVDALVVSTPEGQRVFTLHGEDQVYRTIVEEMQEGAITLLEDGRINYSNRRFAEMVKRPLEQITGSHFSDYVVQSHRSGLHRLLAQAQHGATRGDVTLQASDGTQVPVHVGLGMVVLDQVSSIGMVVTDLTERKRAEEILASEQFIRRLIDNAPIGVAVVGRDFRYRLANPAYQAIADVPVVGHTIAEVFPPDAAKLVQPLVQQVFDSGRELEVRDREAPIRGRTWWNASGIPLRDAAGKTEAVMILVQEVTEQKQAEEALQRSHERLKKVLEVETVGVMFWDLTSGRMTDANDTFLKMMGYSRRDVEAGELTWQKLTPPEFMEVSLAEIRKFQATGRIGPYEKEYFRKDGSRHWLVFAGSSLGDNACVEFCVDIGPRKRAEQALRESEARFRTLAENNPDMITRLDRNHRILYINPGWSEATGMSTEQYLGKSARELGWPAEMCDYWEANQNRAFAGERGVSQETWVVEPSGRERVLWETFVPELSTDGSIQTILCISRDITETKRVEEELRWLRDELEVRVERRTSDLAAANKELEAFGYTVSHDLRAPLRHVVAFADMLTDHAAASLDEKGQGYLKTIAASAQRMGTLIDDLLMLSRLGRKAMTDATVDLRELVEDARTELTPATNGRAIDWQVGPLPQVRGDRALLRNVMVNLLANAVKYSRNRNPACIEIGSEQQDREVVCFVRDNGVGFDMRYVDKLFGVFERLHSASQFEGNGVGLASVRRIIQRHGGRVWAEGVVDQGATFYFALPRSRMD